MIGSRSDGSNGKGKRLRHERPNPTSAVGAASEANFGARRVAVGGQRLGNELAAADAETRGTVFDGSVGRGNGELELDVTAAEGIVGIDGEGACPGAGENGAVVVELEVEREDEAEVDDANQRSGEEALPSRRFGRPGDHGALASTAATIRRRARSRR